MDSLADDHWLYFGAPWNTMLRYLGLGNWTDIWAVPILYVYFIIVSVNLALGSGVVFSFCYLFVEFNFWSRAMDRLSRSAVVHSSCLLCMFAVRRWMCFLEQQRLEPCKGVPDWQPWQQRWDWLGGLMSRRCVPHFFNWRTTVWSLETSRSGDQCENHVCQNPV